MPHRAQHRDVLYGNEGLYIRLADGARVISTTVADNTGPNAYTYNSSGVHHRRERRGDRGSARSSGTTRAAGP
ncbi:MAG: hypothetical protein R3B49_03020 [Phycisphaerales bacterium]